MECRKKGTGKKGTVKRALEMGTGKKGTNDELVKKAHIRITIICKL